MSINHFPKIYWQLIAIIFLPIDSLASLFLPSYHQNHLMASCFTWTSLPIIVRFYCIFNWPIPIQTIPNCFLINYDLFNLKLPRNILLLDPRLLRCPNGDLIHILIIVVPNLQISLMKWPFNFSKLKIYSCSSWVGVVEHEFQ